MLECIDYYWMPYISPGDSIVLVTPQYKASGKVWKVLYADGRILERSDESFRCMKYKPITKQELELLKLIKEKKDEQSS